MTKKVLLGCGLAVIAVVLVLVAVLMMFGAKVITFAEELYDESQRRSEWLAPSLDARGEALFPVIVGAYARESIEAIAGLPLLGIERPGEHGSYRLADGRAMEVFAWRVDRGEVGGVFDDVSSALVAGAYNQHTEVTFNKNSMRFSFSPPRTSGRLWANNGWLFLFLTSDDADLESIESDYLDAIEGATTAPNALPLLPEADAPTPR